MCSRIKYKGGEYEGDLIDGIPHGRGKFTCSDYSYEGEFANGKFHGWGKLDAAESWGAEETYMYNSKGDRIFEYGGDYEGEFCNGVPNGKGKMTDNSDFSFYEGELLDAKPHGKGKGIFYDGMAYEGSWMHGKAHREGKCVFYDKDSIDWIHWINDGQAIAEGRIVPKEVATYEGDWIEGALQIDGGYVNINGSMAKMQSKCREMLAAMIVPYKVMAKTLLLPNADFSSVCYSAKKDEINTSVIYDGNQANRYGILTGIRFADDKAAYEDLIRYLLIEEIVGRETDTLQGFGDELALAVWLIKQFRREQDTELFSRAKKANFDTHCGFNADYIDDTYFKSDIAKMDIDECVWLALNLREYDYADRLIELWKSEQTIWDEKSLKLLHFYETRRRKSDEVAT